MKDFILTIILHDNMTVEFKDGINTLNAHQAARQFIYVEMSGFSLAEGETLHMAFEKGEELHLNPMHMEYSENTGIYGLRIPKEVRDNPGEWTFTLYVKSNWNEVTGTADNVWPSGKYMFYEHSAIADDGTIVPSESDVIIAWNETKKNAEMALNSAERAEAAYDRLINVDLPNKYVTVDTNQTIEGNKTHTGINTFNGFTSINGIGIDADAIVKSSDRFKYPVKSGTLALTSDIPENIVTKDENGQIKVPLAPAQDDDAVSKKYVDDADNTKLNKVEPFANGTYAYTVSKSDVFGTTNGYTEISETDKISTIAKRKANGCIETRTPYADIEAANKGYVDTAISDTQGQLAQTNQNVEDLYTILEQAQVVTVTTLEQAYTTRETADGENIVDGVQTTVKEIRGKTVATENLIPYPYAETTKTQNGVTFTNNGDGTITVNGTATKNTSFFLVFENPTMCLNLRAGENYTLSGCPKGGSDTTFSMYVQDISYTQSIIDYGNGATKATSYTQYYAFIRIAEGYTANNLVFRPMLNIGTEAKPYSKWFAGLKNASFEKIVSIGRNLFNINSEKYSGSATISGRTDTSITISAIGTSSYTSANFLLPDIEGKTVTVSGTWAESSTNEGNLRIQYVREGYAVGSITALTVKSGVSATGVVGKKPSPDCHLAILIYTNGGGKPSGEHSVTYENVQVEIGATATAYEPYISDSLSATTPIELAEYDVAFPETGETKRQSKTIVFDGTENAWGNYGEHIFYGVQVKDSISSDREITYIGNHYEPSPQRGSVTTLPNNHFLIRVDGIIGFRDDSISSVDEWKANLAALYAAGNPLTVTYKTAEVTTESTPFNKSKYLAWKNGSETIEQGTEDNSEYGAEDTLKQDYFTLTGGTTNV